MSAERSGAVRASVVGAGIAGIAAARALRSRGHEVHLFEKSRGLGGRCSTRRTGGLSFDLGAQYFTAHERPFAEAVEPLVREGTVRRWDPSIVRIGEDGSRGPARDSVRYVGIPGMSSLARGLGRGLEVALRARIVRLARDRSDLWSLIAEDGRVHGPYGAVLLTCPAPQAADLLEEEAPDLAEVCRSAELLPCWAVMAAFEDPLDAGFDAAFADDDAIAWVARESSKPGRPTRPECWTLHAGPGWSAAHLEDEPHDVARRVLDRFFRMSGISERSAAHVAAHRWRFARPSTPRPLEPVVDGPARLGVAGDWTRGDRLEDAYLSGLEVGRRIADLPGEAGP